MKRKWKIEILRFIFLARKSPFLTKMLIISIGILFVLWDVRELEGGVNNIVGDVNNICRNVDSFTTILTNLA